MARPAMALSAGGTKEAVRAAAQARLLQDGYARLSTRRVDVRVVQEMTAVGWSDPDIAAQVRVLVQRWFDLLADVLAAAEQQGLAIGPFTAREVATLVALLFIGGESALLLGVESEPAPVRRAIRRLGDLIRIAETGEAS